MLYLVSHCINLRIAISDDQVGGVFNFFSLNFQVAFHSSYPVFILGLSYHATSRFPASFQQEMYIHLHAVLNLLGIKLNILMEEDRIP